MTNENEKKREDYPYELMISSIPTKELALAAHKHMMTFHMAKDYKLRALSYEEFLKLKSDGQVWSACFWRPREGHYCMVIEGGAKRYTTTWSQMTTCYSDFEAGWDACGKVVMDICKKPEEPKPKRKKK